MKTSFVGSMNFLVNIGFLYLILNAIVIMRVSAFPQIIEIDADPWKPVPIPELDPKETEPQYWRNQGLDTLKHKVDAVLNKNKAKNIIFFLGDGMSVATTTAARIYQGQLRNKTGEENKLFFENFPYTGLSKTYCVDKQVPDSASTATAYMCGVKTNYRAIGISAKVQTGDCEGAKVEANRVASIVQWAQEAGKATGIVTTTRVTHASPAGAYAHVNHRDMESDQDVRNLGLDQKICDFDIAKQLVRDSPGRNIKVIMGGGKEKFLTGAGSPHGKGIRSDVDLLEEWLKDKRDKKMNGVYASNAEELRNVDPHKTDYLLGLFSQDHMHYHLENVTAEPGLWEMTEKAIEILRKEENGFFLFVEGGRIDTAHHEVLTRVALDETIEFAKAVQRAYELTDVQDTLMVVTADHSHTLTMSGYPARGYDILNIFGRSADGLPYATLSYANGLGYHPEKSNNTRYNLEYDHFDAWNYTFPSMVPKTSESHGGDDVAVYASGPWSHLFTGNYEQNFIPFAEAYAAQIGPASPKKPSNSASSTNTRSLIMSVPTLWMLYVKFIS